MSHAKRMKRGARSQVNVALGLIIGGLLVAVVVKYADNILKGFACSLAIILTAIMSVFIFGFTISLQFAIGAAFVIGSIFMYGYQPPVRKDSLSEKI